MTSLKLFGQFYDQLQFITLILKQLNKLFLMLTFKTSYYHLYLTRKYKLIIPSFITNKHVVDEKVSCLQ